MGRLTSIDKLLKEHYKVYILTRPVEQYEAAMVEASPQQGDWERRGPQLWATLHQWALGADLADLAAGARWLLQFEWKISCNDCQHHWSQWVREHPADFSSREALFAWTVEAHNAVSRRLGKPQMDVKWALERWGGGEGPSDTP